MARNWALNTVRIFVTDIQKAKQFYCETLGWVPRADGTDQGFLLFDVGSIALVVETINPENQEQRDLVGRFTGVSFTVEDMNSTYQALLSKGVEFVTRPQQQPWGGVIASFLDCDRNGITLVSGVA